MQNMISSMRCPRCHMDEYRFGQKCGFALCPFEDHEWVSANTDSIAAKPAPNQQPSHKTTPAPRDRLIFRRGNL